MSGCNCIEQKHGGVPQEPALQTLRMGPPVIDVLHARGPQLHARSRVQNFQAECLVEEH
jgi:hypothetical protein